MPVASIPTGIIGASRAMAGMISRPITGEIGWASLGVFAGPTVGEGTHARVAVMADKGTFVGAGVLFSTEVSATTVATVG